MYFLIASSVRLPIYVYRYDGNLNGIDDAVVLISYPKDAFHVPKALRAFISTDASGDTGQICGTVAGGGVLPSV